MDPQLQHLIDARAIEQVLVGYFDRIDALDPFGASEFFAEDATADLMTGKIYHGSAQIGRALARILLQYRHTSHHISNHTSRIDGDEAESDTYVYAFHRFPDNSTWHLWARNTDRLRRIDEKWLLTERVLVPIDAQPDWDAIDAGWFRSHPGRQTHDELQSQLDVAYRALAQDGEGM